ncbi:MAG: hypothetical protein WCG97_00450 [bacterium]
MKHNLQRYKGYRNKSGGFIEFIVAIIISIVMLHLLGINITTVLAKPAVREFGLYVKDLLILVWNDLVDIFHFIKSIING